jgi:hypothetical protein
MKKNLLPILLAGAGAVIFFIMKKKKEVSPIEELDETQEATFTTKPKKKPSSIKSKLKSFDINKAITNVSKLKNSKGAQIVKKAIKKKSVKKKGKKSTNTFVAPLQPKAKTPTKFF